MGSFMPLVNCSYGRRFSVRLSSLEGARLVSFRALELVVAPGDRERAGLARRRMLR